MSVEFKQLHSQNKHVKDKQTEAIHVPTTTTKSVCKSYQFTEGTQQQVNSNYRWYVTFLSFPAQPLRTCVPQCHPKIRNAKCYGGIGRVGQTYTQYNTKQILSKFLLMSHNERTIRIKITVQFYKIHFTTLQSISPLKTHFNVYYI